MVSLGLFTSSSSLTFRKCITHPDAFPPSLMVVDGDTWGSAEVHLGLSLRLTPVHVPEHLRVTTNTAFDSPYTFRRGCAGRVCLAAPSCNSIQPVYTTRCGYVTGGPGRLAVVTTSHDIHQVMAAVSL